MSVTVYELDKNALKNSKLSIIEGRLPETSKELVISEARKNFLSTDSLIEPSVGDTINLTLNGKIKQYTIVGRIENSDLDNITLKQITLGAISCLDISDIKNDTIVDVDVLVKNIQNVYKTGKSLEDAIGINKAVEEPKLSDEEILQNALNGVQVVNVKPNISYNGELLNYECVFEANSQFGKNILTVGIFIVAVLMAVSVIMIRSTFNLSYADRIKELGILSSIGMDKKQKNKLIATETRILTFIAIVFGVVLALFLDYVGIKVINSIIQQIKISQLLEVKDGVQLLMKVPIAMIILSIIIVCIIVKIASKLSIKRINKISPIEAIRNSAKINIAKEVKEPKLIEMLFKEEGVLAYKNIKRDKSKHNTVIFSLMISLILFLSVSGLITNLEPKVSSTDANMYSDYIIRITPKEEDGLINTQKVENVIKYLKQNNLVDDCYATMEPFYGNMTELKNSQISETAKELINSGLMQATFTANGDIMLNITNYWFVGDAYNEILRRAGVTQLKENEVIISSSITEKTKFGDRIDITNLKVGDTYTVSGMEYLDIPEQTFKIVGIVEDFAPYVSSTFENGVDIKQVINPETAIELVKKCSYPSNVSIYIKTDARKSSKTKQQS